MNHIMNFATRALSTGLLGVAAIATITAAATAQITPHFPGTPVTTYGTGGAGTGGIVPTIGTASPPRIRQFLEVRVSDVVGGSLGAMLYSMTPTDVPLPGIGRLYVQGGSLWPTVFACDGTPGVAGAGSASISTWIPYLPALIGLSVYAQGFFWDSGAASARGVSHTSGLKLTCLQRSFRNSLRMEFSRIPVGTFMMGSPGTEVGRLSDETQHQVTLTKEFWMQTTEVTQEQWRAVMGSNPSHFQGANLPQGEIGADRPVESVSWNDVQAFIAALNVLEHGANYRLPTEAEWEYACRAGSTTAYCYGDSSSALGSYAWCAGSWNTGPSDVAGKLPNAWGLYDMHGSVMEFCLDGYGAYPTTPVTDPQVAGDLDRVIRGGSWSSFPGDCRSAGRRRAGVSNRISYVGFRLVSSVP